MRERVTFLQGPSADVDPAALQIEAAGLLGPSAEAIRQDRFSLSLDELPRDLATLLGAFDELHLKWASPVAYETLDPFGSRISPGLHVLYTTAENDGVKATKLCSALQAFGSLDCTKPEAFTVTTTEPGSDKKSSYFYQELNDLSAFVASSVGTLCSSSDATCESRLRNLRTASSLDISYESGSQTLKVTPLWPLERREIAVPRSSGRTEVGIFAQDTPHKAEMHELGVAGLLSVLGEKKDPSATVFSFPSRHRTSDSHFSCEFLEPAGLHPTLQLKLSSAKLPLDDAGCAPYAYFTLPKTIFADRYQYEDSLFLASKNLTASRYTSFPVDLEAPAYTTTTWGSSVLLELAPPASGQPGDWTAEVPLHLRYLKPSASGRVPVEVPYPAVFWACDMAGEVDFPTNPFDRRQLGYDGLFSSQTSFWHVAPKPVSGNRITSALYVPVLRDEGAAWIRLGTTVAVGLGFAWVLWKLLGVYRVAGYGSVAAEAARKDKKTR
ncbi:protease B nonderepressible form [Purpureocillium takamizusanense]|uniref:Protein PBN1 n=1 Tax=Purpureocillium takamizusanense TaxID=2060973 RepID=A0A9Q8QMK1_9HYPO|nr:protease B nonderepressible form [Purpureocillium takamizusanense]UNI21479.1 protease B nonderepressible form [Purpureocillium takamizusanense]